VAPVLSELTQEIGVTKLKSTLPVLRELRLKLE